MNDIGKGGGVVEALKTLLSSPVGGWAIAIGIVAYMGWFTMKDRQIIYRDLVHLRETAMPIILDTKKASEEAKSVTEENNRMLQEIRSMMNLPMANQRTLEDIKRELKKQQQEVE